jgi:hypothetical protein
MWLCRNNEGNKDILKDNKSVSEEDLCFISEQDGPARNCWTSKDKKKLEKKSEMKH